ncbi:envelope protein [Shigella flexneri]|nr:envelope protein [Shigella flexneri]
MDQVVVFQKMFEQVRKEQNFSWFYSELKHHRIAHYIYYLGNDSNLLIVFYVQIMPDDLVMQLHRF